MPQSIRPFYIIFIFQYFMVFRPKFMCHLMKKTSFLEIFCIRLIAFSRFLHFFQNGQKVDFFREVKYRLFTCFQCVIFFPTPKCELHVALHGNAKNQLYISVFTFFKKVKIPIFGKSRSLGLFWVLGKCKMRTFGVSHWTSSFFTPRHGHIAKS